MTHQRPTQPLPFPPEKAVATETGLVPRVAHIGLSQSITMKGAVRLAAPGGGAAAAPGGGGSQLAVNASLFTCLVMDMPLEKLKLRWDPCCCWLASACWREQAERGKGACRAGCCQSSGI
jgi:hypothetical protein